MVFIQLFSTRSTRFHGPSEPRLCRRRPGGCPMCGWHRSRGGARALGPLRVEEAEAMRETAVRVGWGCGASVVVMAERGVVLLIFEVCVRDDGVYTDTQTHKGARR